MFVFLCVVFFVGFGALSLQHIGVDVGPRNWADTAWYLAMGEIGTASEEAEWRGMVDLPAWDVVGIEEQRAALVGSINSLRSAMIANDPLVARLQTSDADRYRTMMRVRSVPNARYSAGV